MEDVSSLIQAVESFEEKENPWSDELERFIAHVARTGDILAPWEKVQIVFMNKLRLVMDEFYSANPYKVGKVNANATNDDFDEMKKRLLQLAEEFDSPPFTIQRLCELLVEPKKNYTKCDKFMRGLEKNLMVVSSWNNAPRRLSESNDGMVNGVSVGPSNGFVVNDRLKPHWSTLPPSPVATTPPKIPGAPDFTDVATVAPRQEEITAEVSKEHSEAEETESSLSEGVISTSDQSDEDSEKKSVSATIISSSPPKTINIKRKIDESADEPSTTPEKESTDSQVEESPTKKRKSDAPEIQEVAENATPHIEDHIKSGEKADVKSDSAAKCEKPESQDSRDITHDSNETKNADSADSSQTESQTDVKMDTSDEGSSVDPPGKSAGESQMDID